MNQTSNQIRNSNPEIPNPSLVFMGTPQFAVPSLRALAGEPYDITVVTQPDKPAGRGGRLTPPPVKVLAEELGLPVLQPASLKDPGFRALLAEMQPDVTVLVAYGEYVAPVLLDLPRHGSINLHPSLLPRWRGSTPIQSAILAGDEVTGVSIIRMDRGLDTGPILAQRRTPVAPAETHPELSARLANMGATLLAETLPRWLKGEIEPMPQTEEGATLTRTLSKEDGLIDWSAPAGEIDHRVRAFQPWPGTYTYWQGRLLKVLRARPVPVEGASVPGTLLALQQPGSPRSLAVATGGGGALELLEVQLAGKPPVEARALLTGYPQMVGSVLGSG
ncbi:MAG TPA: methionyl-tRNA formyltransferase [Chloroflexia bacterium]|nr:methionyl-tRNA formyltransferase [Chloroflexia bacterium]